MANEAGAPDGDPEIIIADDPPDEGVIVQPDTAPEEPAPQNVTTSDDLAALRAQLVAAQEAEQRANERAETEAKRATEATTSVVSTYADTLRAHEFAAQTAIAAYQTEAATARADYARLALEGKFDEAADATQRLVRATQKIGEGERRLEELGQAKARFEADQQRAAEATARPAQPEPRQQPAQQQPSAKAQAWINAHPRFLSDQNYRDAALGAHNIAKMKGIQPDTDEYFAFIETQLGERQPAPEPVRRAASSAAPPSRAIAPQAGTMPTSSQVIHLTRAERDTADQTMGYIKDEKERYKRYAMQKQKMIAEKPLLLGQG